MDATIGKATGYAGQLMEHQRTARYPPWIWWNLLSLDAPTIVCLWALLFVHELHLRFQAWEIAALTFTVWIIYIGDRILDGLRMTASETTSDRHKFYMRHCGTILCSFPPFVLAAGLIILEKLDVQTRFAGLVMGAAVIFYFLGIHGVPAHVSQWLPKEILAGGIFAVGAAIPAWIHAAGLRNFLLPEVILFAGLCVLNCVTIECWEHNRGGRRWEKRPYWLIRLADARIESIAATLILYASCMVVFLSRDGIRAEVAEASILSILILIAVERRSNNLSPRALRILADAALLTPAVFLFRW
jgi:hypothetical protein